jgi:CubicO group peptidase (beta-lactamase class C family)
MKRLTTLLLTLLLAGTSGPPEGGHYSEGGHYAYVASGFSRTVIAAAPPTIPQQGIAALTTYLQQATARADVPGAVVAVVGRDGLLYHEAFGRMSVARNQPMAKDTIFNIASMTKPVTSVAIMMLVEEGKLKLDDDVAKYLPKYKNPVVISKFNEADATYETRPAKRPITVRHLLTHTSGIGYGFASATVAALQRKTPGLSELDMPLLFDPGDSWAYGASTRVLGTLVETVSGQKLDAFLESRVMRPLGMQDTAYAVPQAKVARVVAVNAKTNGAWVERPVAATLPANVAGDGGLYSTAGDYAMFVRMLLNGGRLGSTRLLSEKTVRTMFENHTRTVVVPLQRSTNQGLSKDFPFGAGEDNWGLGFELAQPKARKPNTRATGSGTWAGIFNTHFWIDQKSEVGVIVMTQTLPFYDEQAMKVLAGVEEIVYRSLK